MADRPHLVVPLLKAFYWFDEGLQAYLRHRGWRGVSRPQSMVMANVVMGVTRPTDIARNLGVSRQAIHVTIGQMIKKGMIELRDDPNDRRGKTVVISATGRAMRRDAQTAMVILTKALQSRIGARHIAALHAAFAADWGRPPTDYPPASKGRRKGSG
ncbi:MAG TPA: MarR family winged helix-turn-helix transcriptional regulator [Rhizomicrobium sp.]|nr:MarR family winged helix-turn-helix transcriptional regulator [Rhizomicrobium sp.]